MPSPSSASSPKSATLSPAELAQLEHAFATDPNSEAYRPLAEAYLAMGRFMEAMVVCKKGVKAHPDRADPRVLLARVYADQGKDKKALEELEGAIQTAPQDAPALRLAASLLLKAGENDKGKEYLLRAHKAAPGDAETQELLEKWKIEVPVEAAPASVVVAPSPAELSAMAAPAAEAQPAAPAVAPAQAPGAPAGMAPQGIPPGYQRRMTGEVPVAAPQGIPPGYARSTTSDRPAPRATNRPAQRSVAPTRPQIDLSRFEDDDEPARAPRNNGAIFLGFVALAVVSLGAYFMWTAHLREVRRQAQEGLDNAAKALSRDSFASYKEACDAADSVLKVDPDNVGAHSYLAYAYAIRWGEHGEGETAHQQATDHLEKAKRLKREHSHLLAADALVSFYGGAADQAEKDLGDKVSELEKSNRASPLLYETLGIIEMRNGNLEKAAAHLKKALDQAPGEPRIHSAVGDLYRRQGQEMLAWTYYDNALRYEKNHADAVLGKTLLVLEAQNPDYKIAEDLIRRVRDAEPPPSPRQLAMAYLLDGMRLNQTGKKAEGLAQEDRALALDRQNPEIHVLRGRRMLRDGQAAQGQAEIQEAIRLDPKRASFYVELARAQMAQPNGAKDAISSLNKALNTLPNSPKLLALQGDAYMKLGDTRAAQSAYEKALAADPKAALPEARLALAEMARKNRDFGKAQELFDRAIAEFGSNARAAEAYASEGQMLEERGGVEPNKVLELYKKSIGVDGNYAPSYFYVAKLLASTRRPDVRASIKEALETYLKLDPKGPYVGEAQRMMVYVR